MKRGHNVEFAEAETWRHEGEQACKAGCQAIEHDFHGYSNMEIFDHAYFGDNRQQ